MDTKKILILIGNSDIDNQIEKSLIKADFNVIQTDDLNEMISLQKREKSDVVIADWKLINNSVKNVIDMIEDYGKTGLIILLKNQNKKKQIQILEDGADYCLQQPIDIRELVAKTKALTRRIDRLHSI